MQEPQTTSSTAPAPGSRLKHSGLGIASFIIAILTIILFMGLLFYAGVLEAVSPGALAEDSPQSVILGLVIVIDGMLAVIGLILGVVGLLIQGYNRLFAILGVILNLFLLLSIVVVMLLGA